MLLQTEIPLRSHEVSLSLKLSLRPVTPQDDEFLCRVYASTREEELARVSWTVAQRNAFVRMQFDAQRQSYALEYPEAEYSVILRDEEPIGRLIVSRTADRIELMDIALLPEHRNQGIGAELVRGLQGEAAEANKPLRLYVEFFNPALHLYERLGFTRIGETGVYLKMEWQPA